MGILVIDANPIHLDRVIGILKSSGYGEIFSFQSVQDARRSMIGEERTSLNAMLGIDLVLVDVTGDPEGFHFVDKIRRSPVYKDIPVVVMCEGNRSEAISSAFAYGATDFISKPVDITELKARARSGIKLKYEIERRKARERELIEVTNQLSDLNEILANLSLIDALTGIPNRRCFDDTIQQEWRRAARHGGDLALLMIDVDHFKMYNDTYGHQMGDTCLQEVAKTIGQQLRRPGDLLARYGGEEFAIILPNTNAEQTASLQKAIMSAISGLALEHNASPTSDIVTISMGVASVTPDNDINSPQELIQIADQALYKAKESGRNQVYISDKKQISA
ncbi:MAG: diguanylate cyclase [Pseudobacteriovorax sp.]|nr:diguanylate cyclase [Pseudobacteriovorax sp.]